MNSSIFIALEWSENCINVTSFRVPMTARASTTVKQHLMNLRWNETKLNGSSVIHRIIQ